MQTSTFSYDPQRHSSTLRQLIEINISLHPQHEQTSNSVFYWPSTQANVYFPASPCRNILLPFWTGTAGACISLHGQRLTPATSAADWLDGVGHSLYSARVATSHTVWMHTEVSQRINKEPGLKIYKIWLASPFACHVFRYYETISEVLSSVRKMEESLKRLKQARKGATTTSSAGANGGPTDDSKIRLQLALDVEYLGEQVGGVWNMQTNCFQVLLQTASSDFWLFSLTLLCAVVCLRSRRWVFSKVTSPCSPLWWTLWKRPESSPNRTSKVWHTALIPTPARLVKDKSQKSRVMVW